MPRARAEVFDPMEAEKPSRCIRFLRLLWKFSRCVFSHVTLISLVVAYCVIGAYAFEILEAKHEKQVNRERCGIASPFNSIIRDTVETPGKFISTNRKSRPLDELFIRFRGLFPFFFRERTNNCVSRVLKKICNLVFNGIFWNQAKKFRYSSSCRNFASYLQCNSCSW